MADRAGADPDRTIAPGVRRHAARLRTGQWFAGLDAPLQTALLQAARERPLVDGERLFSRGDPPEGLFAVVDGALRVTAVTPAGREVVLTRAEPPAWLGEIAVFDRQPRTHDCIADGQALVLHVPLAALDALLSTTPRWWRDLGVLVAGKLRLAFHVLEDAAAFPVVVRLARRLVHLSGGLGERLDHSRRLVTVSQDQLASMIGVSRQTVNAALKDLESRGLVRLSYGQIELVDDAALLSLEA
jgi:CRP-like cAMP-binding protein